MNSISLLNLSFWEKVATIFDILPKTIYFLYACLASAVDAMQALVRKLAGLDTYFRADTGAAVIGTDPLSEFVYGILGFGKNSSIYDALNTVFWSLAIFGLIVLVLTTMVAIIKSHYSEDSTQTNPWKYIYTAIKSLLTFVILPVIVVIGLQLSSFVLRTLDNITAGAGNEDELTTMYGSNSVQRLKPGIALGFGVSEDKNDEDENKNNTGKKTYTYYDMFGATNPSTNTTFSGMMFNACMYSANRARTGAFSLSYFTSGREDGVNSLMNDFFAQGSEYTTLTDEEARLEFVAGQVDYAFANCLQFNSGYSYAALKGEAGDAAPVAGWSDWYGASKSTVDGFSKYDVATIWIFYDLWQFNMIVGYAGVFVTFAIMISIVVGLMSRLIKGAALFLVYPSILGIAPLDDFKAFKSWSQMFMQQVMMAFGSIIGMNLLLLILPYVQQIKFFEIDIINYIINVLMMITGLIMAKDFISIVSGFVGGGDANASGGEMKGQVAGALKAGVSAPAKIFGGAARITTKGALTVGKGAVTVGKGVLRGGRKVARTLGNINANKRADRRQKKIEENTAKRQKALTGYNTELANFNNALKIASKDDTLKKQYGLDKDKLLKKYKKRGFSDDRAKEFADRDYKNHMSLFANDLSTGRITVGGFDAVTFQKAQQKYANADAKLKRSEKRYARTVNTYNLATEKDGSGKVYHVKTQSQKDIFKREFADWGDGLKEGWGKFKESAKEIGEKIAKSFKENASVGGFVKTSLDSVTKALGGGLSTLGVDKTISAIKKEMGESLTYKGGPFKPSKEGDALQRQIASEQKKQADTQTEILKDIKKELSKQNSKGSSGGSGGSSGGGSSGGSGGTPTTP